MRVLIVVPTLRVANGVATVIMNYYDELVKNDVIVDFAQIANYESTHTKKINSNKGQIYTFDTDKSYKRLRKFFDENKYDIIHINIANFFSLKLAMAAKRSGVKNIVYHSHNTKIPGSIKTRAKSTLLNKLLVKISNNYLACTNQAGVDVYSHKNFIILPNAIDIEKYKFNKEKRDEIRKELNIDENDFVIGTVCRIAHQKNPLKMINIFNKIVKKKPNSKFLYIGSAPTSNTPLEVSLRQKIKEYNLEDKFILAGSKEDANNYYNAMDVFLMPSFWEGLGITYIESQANSLPTFASSVVPKDTYITNYMNYISLDDKDSIWADEILKYDIRSDENYIANEKLFNDAGYNIKNSSDALLKIYQDIMQGK